jgi:quercetin dioxygenase-like cupin family protein
MIEEIFTLSNANEKTVEKVIQDDNLDYMHMIFNNGEGLPIHFSNSNVYMTVLQGRLSIGLDDNDIHLYPAGTLLKIPYHTKMNVQNLNDELLELIVIKAPAPKNYQAA